MERGRQCKISLIEKKAISLPPPGVGADELSSVYLRNNTTILQLDQTLSEDYTDATHRNVRRG